MPVFGAYIAREHLTDLVDTVANSAVTLIVVSTRPPVVVARTPYVLSPPVVVSLVVYEPVAVLLAPISHERFVRLRAGRSIKSGSRPPAVVGILIVYAPIKVTLTPKNQERTYQRQRRARNKLGARVPIVVRPAPLYYRRLGTGGW